MPTVQLRSGMFSWIDVMTTDSSVAIPFYTSVFGWTVEEVPSDGDGPYRFFVKDGVPAAGIGEMSDDMKEHGVPSSWNSYIQVSDVDAVHARALELGAESVVPPMDVMDQGRMAAVADPSGATVSLWQSTAGMDEGTFNEPGRLTWNELVTRDPDAARSFYSDLLGWEWDAMEMPQGSYWVIMNHERANGGVMRMTDEWPERVPSHWMVYIGSDDVDASAERVRTAGGTIQVEPMDIAVGRFCVASDPTGAPFTIFHGGDM